MPEIAAEFTTRVEILTDDGRRATIDQSGWHSVDHVLLPKLLSDAPFDPNADDPVKTAAEMAVDKLGVRIILMKRKEFVPGVTGAISHLYRAITSSALYKAIQPKPIPWYLLVISLILLTTAGILGHRAYQMAKAMRETPPSSAASLSPK